MPAAANLSMLGVRYLRLLSVGSLVNGTEVSCQPMSSTMNSTIFGRCWLSGSEAMAVMAGDTVAKARVRYCGGPMLWDAYKCCVQWFSCGDHAVLLTPGAASHRRQTLQIYIIFLRLPNGRN